MIVGIDSHKEMLAACIVDRLGRVLGAQPFSNTPEGHEELLVWARGHGEIDRFGIEGSGGFGRAVARRLDKEGERVFEVPANLTLRERRRLKKAGKSDPEDALAIARVTARERDLPPVRRHPAHSELRLLVDYREQLLSERTKLANRVHADLTALRPGYQRLCPKLVTKKAMAEAKALLHGIPGLHSDLARRRLQRVAEIDDELRDLGRDIAGRVAKSGTRLLDIHGIGSLTAARILAEVDDVRRFRSKDHFASANGTAPIPASSGQTIRHRLNRGGNRRLNRAIHLVALTQARSDPRGRTYVERRRAEGKTWREAIRCLKRRLSDVIYRCLLRDLATAPVAA